MYTMAMSLEPGFLYRFNRDLWQTITSSHLTLQTKQGRIKNFKLSGVTRQVETTGAQLFDVNQIPKGTEGGATLDIVDDQIIISGSGALTSTFGRSKKLTHEETMQLIGDNRTFTLSVTQYTNPPAFVNFADASKNLISLTTLAATSVTQTIPDNMDMNTLYITYGVYNIAGAEIVPGKAKIMLNAGDTALPWEPYTGATSSPSPEYPQDIQGVGVRTKNLLNDKRMLDFILQKPGASIVQFDGRRCLKLDGGFNFPDFNLYEGFEPEKRYTLTYDGFYEKYKTEAYLGNGFAFTLQNGGRNLSLMGVSDIGTWRHKTTTSDTGVTKLTFTYGTQSVIYIDLDTIQLEEGTISTPYEPYGYRTDVVCRGKNLADISGAKPYTGTTVYQKIPGGFVLDASTEGHRVALIPCSLKSGVNYVCKCRCIYKTPGELAKVYLPEIRQYLTPTRDGDNLSCAFVPTADVKQLGFYFSVDAIGTGVEAEITELQVEEGSTPTPYQPYAYYTAPIYTKEQVYQGDKIQLVDGQYCHMKRIGKFMLDPIRNLYITNIDSAYATIVVRQTVNNIPSVMLDMRMYCTHFGYKYQTGSYKNWKTPNVFMGYEDQSAKAVITLRSSEFPDLESLKAFCEEQEAAGTPITFFYEMKDPIAEPLPAISQQALRNLPTYKGTTIIGTTDPLEPEITVSYRPQTDYSKLPGLEVDYETGTEIRLGAAKKLTPGTAFNRYHMYGNRRRCNVLDDGTITAYEGEPGYTEDGSNGQVMVYQPKFYYQVVPLKLEPQTDGIGYHLRHAQYWVSPTLQPGFRLHPDFDVSGQEVDYVLLPAYEGSIYDTSEDAYILDDAQVMDVATDKLCSIAGAKPASGKIQQLTRPHVEQLARNRGPGWHSDNIKAVSANQLLMIIELGTMNTQAAIGQGVVSIPDTPNTENNSIITGGTSSLGNTTGMANGTSGKVSVAYRGMENPWGNIWKQVYGVNIWGNGTMKGGVPYICKDYNFAENKNTGNYESAGFTLSNTNGYISAMGYSEEYDWLFLPSETLGNNSLPVGDYLYITPNLNGYRNSLFGGSWDSGSYAGTFCWGSIAAVGYSSRTIGARLIYVPQ